MVNTTIKREAFRLMRRMTSQHFRQGVKHRVWHLRSTFAPLIRVAYGTYTTLQLEAELRAHLPRSFDILMAHSSISDMQPMYLGTAQELVALLLQIVGPERTLAMPAFFFGSAELYNADYYRRHERFDVRRTPSEMGLVTEMFRRYPGVKRSLHPTHSVCALGPLANELVETHHLSEWACGELSPFGVMGRHRTVVLGLGTQYFRSLTQVHSMEEILGDRFPISRAVEEPVRVELVDGVGRKIPYEMSRPLRGVIRDLGRLRHFISPGDIDEWTFRGTDFFITTAAKVDIAIRNAALQGQTLYLPARE